MTTDRDALESILIRHYRASDQFCVCGWGELGKSHAMHQADAILAAGWRAPTPAAGRADPSHQHTWWEDNGNAGCNCGATLRP